jgi:hypothetical protein
MKRIPGFDDKAMGLIELLSDYDWTGRVTSKGHWLGKSPDGKTSITIPSKMDNPSRAEKNAKATFKRWVREQYPDIAVALDAADNEDDPMIQDILMGKAHRQVAELAVTQAAKHFEKELSNAMMEWPVRTPWLAHKASNTKGGVRYESEAVVQRTWNNGDVDYECAFPECGYTNTNPRSVGVHYGRQHTMKGETPPATQDGPKIIDPAYTEPLLQRDYKPTDRLITALAAVLEKLNGHGTPSEMAEEILRWFHDRPDIEHVSRPDVQLTDADILFRIRRLVAPTLEGDLTQARAELETVKVERDLAIAQLAKVSRDLESIKELIGEVGR